MTSNGVISFGNPFASFTPVSFPLGTFTSNSSHGESSYSSGNSYSTGSGSHLDSSVGWSSSNSSYHNNWSSADDYSGSYQSAGFANDMCYYFYNIDGTLVFSHRHDFHSGDSHGPSGSYESSTWYSSTSGDCGYTGHIEGCMPQLNGTSDQANAIIAVLWSDIDLRLGNGRLFIRQSNDPATIMRAYEDIFYGTGNIFYPSFFKLIIKFFSL